MEMKEKEDKLFLQHEKTLSQLAVRSAPFGTDRFRREYWSFQGDDRLFVQQRQEKPTVQQQQGILSNLIPRHRPQATSSTSAAAALTDGKGIPVPYETEIEDSLWRMFETRPNRYNFQWGVYTSNGKELWYLWDALDDRGEREVELKAALKARFELEEPTVNYLKTGSHYLGKRLLRQFRRKVSCRSLEGVNYFINLSVVCRIRSSARLLVGYLPMLRKEILMCGMLCIRMGTKKI